MHRTLTCLLPCLLLCGALAGCRPHPPAKSEPYIRIEPSGKSTGGALTMQQGLTEQQVGLAFYPGATVNKSGLVAGPRGNIAGAELQTTAPYAQVVAFYRGKYAPRRPKLLQRDDNNTTMLNWQDRQGNYTVMIKRDVVAKRTLVTLAKTSR